MIKKEDQFDEIYWERLSLAIQKGYVIPVIGADAILCAPQQTIGQKIFEEFCLETPIPGAESLKDYDDYLYILDNIQLVHSRYKDALEKINCEDMDAKIILYSKTLVDFLRLKSFPVILYCSPDMKINVLLKHIWKERYDVNSHNNTLNIKDFLFTPYNGCLLRELDYKRRKNQATPYVVHLMGKADNLSLPRAFAITEDDKLFYIRKLLNPRNMPPKLTQALNNKIFLFIGCNFPDWQFRFLCNALMQEFTTRDAITEGFPNTMVDSVKSQVKGFTYFLNKVNLSLCTEQCNTYLKVLLEKYELYRKREKHNLPPRIDLFISYCWEDRDIALKLAEELQNHGVDVWLDKKSTCEEDRNRLIHGGDFDLAIRDAISRASFFIPIITNRILQAETDRYVFNEWRYAISNNSRKRKQNPERGYIIPCYIGVQAENFTIKDTQLSEQFRNIVSSSHNGYVALHSRDLDGPRTKDASPGESENRDLKENIKNIIEMIKIYG